MTAIEVSRLFFREKGEIPLGNEIRVRANKELFCPVAAPGLCDIDSDNSALEEICCRLKRENWVILARNGHHGKIVSFDSTSIHTLTSQLLLLYFHAAADSVLTDSTHHVNEIAIAIS